MRSKLMATLLLVMALLGGTSAAAAQAPETVTKPSGVTVIGGDCLAAADTPWDAISYAAALVDH